MVAYKLYAIVFVYSNHMWADALVVIALSISAILLDHCWIIAGLMTCSSIIKSPEVLMPWWFWFKDYMIAWGSAYWMLYHANLHL